MTDFQLGSFKKRFPINGERITNANGEVEAEGSQAGHRKGKGTKDRNWKEEDTELLVTLYENRACLRDVAQKLNKQGAYCQIHSQISVREISYLKGRLQK